MFPDTIMASNKSRLIIGLLLGFAVLAARFSIPYDAAVELVGAWGYWLILIGVIVFSFPLAQFIYDKCKGGVLQRQWKVALIALLGTLFIESREPRQFKVMFDEFVISGVARDCHYLREPGYPIKAHRVASKLEVIQTTIDKRPFFFPFILSCLHDLTGFRPENVFILNGLSVFLLLFLTQKMGAYYGGQSTGYVCVLLWLGLPVLAQCATSGGYDVFNITMYLLTLYFGKEYIKTGSDLTQSLFVLSAVYLAQVRHESIVMLLAVGAIILVKWHRDKVCRLGWLTVFAPLHLFLPLIVNLIYVKTPTFMQTGAGQSYFSFEYLGDNMEKAVWYLFNFDYRMTNSSLLAIIGIIASVAFCVRMCTTWRKWLAEGEDVILVGLGVVIIGNFIVILCNFWGQLDDPVASRFCLPLCMFFICSFAWLIGRWRGSKPIPVWLAGLAVLGVITSVPAAAHYTSTRALMKGREYAWLLETIRTPEHQSALIIAHPAGPILFGFSAIDYDTAERYKWKIGECLKQHVYPEILVLESWAIDLQTGLERPYSDDRSMDVKKLKTLAEGRTTLGPAFKKELVAELRIRPNVITRICRVISVEGLDSVPPEAYLKDKVPFENIGAYYRHVYSMLP